MVPTARMGPTTPLAPTTVHQNLQPPEAGATRGSWAVWQSGIIGAIGALMERVDQPRTLLFHGRNAGTGTTQGS